MSDLRQHQAVTVKDTASSYAVDISLSGAQGEPGPQGPVGPQGPKGDKGDPGLNSVESYVDLGDKTGSITLDYNAGRWQRLRLTGNITITAINNLPAPPVVGALFLMVVQDATGGRTITWPAGTKWPIGSTPYLSVVAGAVDIVQLTYVNGVCYGLVGAWGYS